MKRTTKILMILLLTIANFSTAYSRIGSGRKVKSDSKTDDRRLGMQSISDVKADVLDIDSTEAINCDKYDDDGYIPFDLLRNHLDDPDGVRIEFTGPEKDRARIIVPKYIKNCMKLKLSYKQINGNIYVSAQNTFFDDNPKYSSDYIGVEDDPTIKESYRKLYVQVYKSKIDSDPDFKLEKTSLSNACERASANAKDKKEQIVKECIRIINNLVKTPQRKLTQNEKYEKCMQDEKLVDEDGNIRRDEADYSGGYSQSFAVNFNEEKDIKVRFSSPNQMIGSGGGYERRHIPIDPSSSDDKRTVKIENEDYETPDSCFSSELMKEAGHLLFESPYQDEKDYIANICNGLKHEKILSALKDLDKNTVGNAKLLNEDMKNIFKKVLENALEESKEVFAEEQMKIMQEAVSEIMTTDNKKLATPHVNDYMSALNKIEKHVLDPKIKELKMLYKKAGTLDMKSLKLKQGDISYEEVKEERERVANRIKTLNDEIKKYSGDKREELFPEDFLQKMASDFGKDGAANKAYSFYLKSNLYGKLNFGSPDDESDPPTPRQIEISLKVKNYKFRKNTRVLAMEHDARTGGDTYSGDYKDKAESNYEIAQKYANLYRVKEQEYAEACQQTMYGYVSNPAKCMQGRRDAAKRQKTFKAVINKYTKKGNKFKARSKHFYELEKGAREKDDEDEKYSFLSDLSDPFADKDDDDDDDDSIARLFSDDKSNNSNNSILSNPFAMQQYMSTQYNPGQSFGGNPYMMQQPNQMGNMQNNILGGSPYMQNNVANPYMMQNMMNSGNSLGGLPMY